MFKHLSSSELTCFTSAVELGTKIRDNVKSIINKLGDWLQVMNKAIVKCYIITLVLLKQEVDPVHL